jgi:hypothetical protein
MPKARSKRNTRVRRNSRRRLSRKFMKGGSGKPPGQSTRQSSQSNRHSTVLRTSKSRAGKKKSTKPNFFSNIITKCNKKFSVNYNSNQSNISNAVQSRRKCIETEILKYL